MEFLPYGLDILVVGVILLMAIWGYREGFLLATFSFLPMVCAFIGMKMFTATVAAFFKTTVIYEKVFGSIAENLSLDANFAERWMEPDLLSYMELPSFLESFLEKAQIENIGEAFDFEGASLFFAESVADVCVFVFSGILIFFVILIVGKILLRLLDVMAKLPVLNFFNTTLGAAFGMAQGVLWIWVAGAILALQEFSGSFTEIFIALENTYIANIFYEHNVLLQMILQIFG